MYGPDDDDGALVRPPTPAARGPWRWFDGGDPETGRWPTIVRDWFLNIVLDEFKTLLASVGLSFDKGNDGQVLDAVQRIARASGPRWVRSAPGIYSWVCPPGIHWVTVRATAGGGRGSAGTTTAGSCGGGGGGHIAGTVPVAPGLAYSVGIGPDGTCYVMTFTVPAGGNATAAGPGAGGAPTGGLTIAGELAGVLLTGGGGGYGYIVGGTAFGGGGGSSAAYYGPNIGPNNGGRPADQVVAGLDGAPGQGGTGGPNGPGGAGGAALVELWW